jgi:hypothetical protein
MPDYSSSVRTCPSAFASPSAFAPRDSSTGCQTILSPSAFTFPHFPASAISVFTILDGVNAERIGDG